MSELSPSSAIRGRSVTFGTITRLVAAPAVPTGRSGRARRSVPGHRLCRGGNGFVRHDVGPMFFGGMLVEHVEVVEGILAGEHPVGLRPIDFLDPVTDDHGCH